MRTLAAAFVILAAPAPVLAATAILSPADMAATDFIDWEQLAFDNPTPVAVTSNLGAAATLASSGGNVTRLRQNAGFNGNFTPGDWLVVALPAPDLTISFATPVAGVGTQWQANFFGAFGANLAAFDAADNPVGVVSREGLSNNAADGSAIFLGIRSPSLNISRVVLTLDFSALPNDVFAINRLLITSTPIPEPATWATLIAGFGLVGLMARRRRVEAAA